MQTKELLMGSSLLPIMTEIYMNRFENKFLSNFAYKIKIMKWIRCINDILITQERDTECIDKFMKELNSIETSIQEEMYVGNLT